MARKNGPNSIPPGPCPHCMKGKHWKKDCRSKYHKDGTPLPDLPEQKN